ncbi:MAG: S41 family peptidase [Flavobacteriaceae bacterium]|nr:S41 family peptidase [Flavobacteriaceae bacterium]MBS9768570.1 S41 family peptidase [Flavobacteriaceae bacterium]
MTKRFFTMLLVGIFALQIGIAQQNENDKATFDLAKNLTIYHNILKELNLLYVDSLDNPKLIKTGIDSMLKGLDPYTVYIPEKEMDDFKTQTTGEYGGIGTLVQKQGNFVTISQIYEGLPADKAGVKAGDKIVALNGKNVKGWEMQKVTEIMKGRPNTSFKMTVERPYAKQKTHKLTITREKIQLDCVPFDTLLNKKVGYLIFTNFTNKGAERIKATVKKLKKEGATSLIIDLRGNPGGLLDQAVKIVNLFVPKNEIVVATKGRISQWDRNYQTTKSPLDTEIPIVVLTSSGSASAAEILAGTLQDLDRGVVMGTRSFGKGLVQTTRELGYNSKLKLTTSKYYIPSGRCIQALDYTHRNEDGSVGHVPDSLITAFKTRNGRTVYDGGGIMPDVEIKRDTYSKLTAQLLIKHQITDFATFYANTHEKPQYPFVLTDAIYSDFVKFVTDAKFEYKSASFDAFEKLKEAIKKEKRKDSIDLMPLEKALKPQLRTDLVQYKNEIADLLEYEINIRFFYQKGGYAQGVRTDKLIKKAVELLEDTKRYQGILSGKIPSDSSQKPKGKPKEKL